MGTAFFMNTVHEAIIKHIRDNVALDNHPDIFKLISNKSDLEVIRLMFQNYRGLETGRGLMLSYKGFEILEKFFTGYRVKLSKDKKVLPIHMVYLDLHSCKPYFYDMKEIVHFDAIFATQLTLVGGDISALMEMNGGLR